jgi:Holliday junction resolvase RusA-like endonuclease
MVVTAMVIPVTPMGAPRMTKQDRWTDKARGKGRAVVIRYFHYQDDIMRALPGYVLPEILKIEFYMPMPKSWSKKEKAAKAGQYHQATPDVDNLCKGFMDTWKLDKDGNKINDSHVAVLHAGKYWCAEGEAPCIVLEL